MSLVLIPVKIKATRANGDAVVGANVRVVLTVAEADDGIVVPDNILGVTDENGEVTLNLWPNSRGVNGSQYIVVIQATDLYFSGLISVPEAPNTAWPIELETLINQPPYPSRSAAEQAQLLAQQYMTQAKGYRDDASASALDADAQAASALASKTAAALSEANAAGSATAAQIASNSALAASRIYSTKALGLVGVASPGYFYVPSTVNGETLILYQNNAGNALEIARFTKMPAGSEIMLPPFVPIPTGWFDTGRRCLGAAALQPIITNGSPSLLLSDADGDIFGWYDFSDLTTLFTDTAGTIPVTADGDPVGKILDKSGQGLHWTAMNGTTARPTWRTAGGYSWLEWNGTTNGMQTAATALLSGYTQIAAFAAIRKTADPGHLAGILEFRTSIAANSFGLDAPIDATTGLAFSNAASAMATTKVTSAAYPDNVDRVLVGIGDVLSQVSMLRIDGAMASFNAGNQGTGGYDTGQRLYLGARQGNTFFFTGRMYGIILRRGKTSQEQYHYLERWLATKCPAVSMAPIGQNLPFVDEPTSFLDTGTLDTASSLFTRTSSFARLEYTTTATEIEVTAFTNFEAAYIAGSADIGVFVNGVYQADISFAVNGYSTGRAVLPSGLKTVSIVNGPQSRPYTGKTEGVFIKRVAANSPLTRSTPAPVNRLLIYGDSIAVGDSATPRAQKAWAMLLRTNLYPRSIALEAYGFRALFDDCVDAAAITAFVAKLVAYNPSKIMLTIGTNDKGLNKWSAASFGAQYAALLDAIHAALPAVPVICQTPLIRVAEAANTFGSTMDDYRAQIVTAQAARASYCSLIDGKAILVVGDLSGDGIHPTTAGHVKYEAAVRPLV